MRLPTRKQGRRRRPLLKADLAAFGDPCTDDLLVGEACVSRRAAWALFPGEVAYVWHGALHATTVAESLIACGFDLRAQIVWAKERLVPSRGDYHWQHEPCWYAVRSKGKGRWSGDRKQTTPSPIPSRGQEAPRVCAIIQDGTRSLIYARSCPRLGEWLTMLFGVG